MKNFSLRRALAPMAVAALAVTTMSAHAVDGVLLIDQARVNAAGGFPFRVTQPGSYRLAGNLKVPDANTDAIKVESNWGVTIDLNGFTISGTTVCFPAQGVCSGAGTGMGINGGAGTRVVNGYVVNMGGTGIAAGTVEDVFVASNGALGVQCTNCLRITAYQNGGTTGIDVASGGSIRDSAAVNNFGDGIRGNYISVTNCAATGNGKSGTGSFGHGISVKNGTVSTSTSYANRLFGIASSDSTISNNSASNNETGISGQGGRISGNTVADNRNYGIWAARSMITDNKILHQGSVSGAALLLGVSPGNIVSSYGGNHLVYDGAVGVSGFGVQTSINICNTGAC